MSRITVDRTYSHSRAKLWRALTERELLARWLMPNDFVAEVGHQFTFTTDPGPGFDGIVHCEVLVLEAPQRLSFTWKGGPIDTVVTFELEEVEDGTRLVMVQDGFRGLKAWLVSRMLALGCRTLYGKRLPAVLATFDQEPEEKPRTTPPPSQACMSPWQKILAGVLSLFDRKARP